MKYKDDIVIPIELGINPYTYLDIVLKYESYIKTIYLFGGYMFLKHIYKFSAKADRQTFNDIHSMEESKLLKIVNVNNNSYVILTKTSLKFLKQKSVYLHPPTSTQLKTSCFLAEYVSNPFEFFQAKKPYTWFLEKYKNEIEKYKSNSQDAKLNFLNNFRDSVKMIKEEEIKSNKFDDVISKLHSSRIYFDNVENSVITFLILDFDRSKNWIHKTVLEKIEPALKKLAIYTGYNIKILVANDERKKCLLKELKRFNNEDLMFFKDISVIDLEIDSYFKAVKQKESFLKDIDRVEIKEIKEKLKNK